VYVGGGRVTHTRANALGSDTPRHSTCDTQVLESAQGTAQMQRNPRNHKQLAMLAPSIRHAGRRETPPPPRGVPACGPVQLTPTIPTNKTKGVNHE
jgi:hypothetical protein